MCTHRQVSMTLVSEQEMLIKRRVTLEFSDQFTSKDASLMQRGGSTSKQVYFIDDAPNARHLSCTPNYIQLASS